MQHSLRYIVIQELFLLAILGLDILHDLAVFLSLSLCCTGTKYRFFHVLAHKIVSSLPKILMPSQTSGTKSRNWCEKKRNT